MGDLVQTTPVMAGLKERYPAARITLLVNSVFSEICNYIPFIDRLFILNKDNFEKGGSDGGPGLVGNFRYLEELLNEINNVEYDLAINFTHSNASAVLTSLVKAKEVRGFAVDAEGHSLIKHPWIRYFFNVVPGRAYNPFHLCDIYIKAGGAIPKEKGLHLHVPEEAKEWAQAILRETGIGDGDLLIGLQLGASRDNRRWPIPSFAELADRLAEAFGARILLIGSAAEVSLGREFEELTKTRPLNLIGKTDLREVAALLKRCHLLISNDTGPLHIATAVGTRVVGIFLSTAHFRETGPYGEGHYVIEADIPCSPCGFQVECNEMVCKEMVCKETIRVDNVFELVRMRALSGDGSLMEPSPMWENVQVYCSCFAEDGLLDFYPLIRRSLKREALYAHLYRQTWFEILDGKGDGEVEKIHNGLMTKINTCYTPEALVKVVESIKVDLDAFRRMKELAEEGLRRVALIANEAGRPSPDVVKIKEIWEGVPFIDQEIETIGYAHPPLRPLILLFRYGKEGLEGKDIAILSEETCNLYRDIKTHASMMVQLIERLMKGG